MTTARWHGDGRGQVAGSVAELAAYVDDAIIQLSRRFAPPHPLAEALQRSTGEIAGRPTTSTTYWRWSRDEAPPTY
jgi:hypothetical protein